MNPRCEAHFNRHCHICTGVLRPDEKLPLWERLLLSADATVESLFLEDLQALVKEYAQAQTDIKIDVQAKITKTSNVNVNSEANGY